MVIYCGRIGRCCGSAVSAPRSYSVKYLVADPVGLIPIALAPEEASCPLVEVEV